MRKLLILSLLILWSSIAISGSDDDSKVAKLGKLAGELILHATVLKNLDALCYPSKPESNYLDVLLNDIKKMPQELQDMVNLRVASGNNLGALVATGIVKKANGCETDDFRSAYSKTEGFYQNSLINWLQKKI